MPKGTTQCKHYEPLLSKFAKSLSGWKMHKLSHADRLTLIKHVSQTQPIYYMEAQILPKIVTRRIEASQRKFWWGK
jgi:hypothetical protein